MDEALWWKPYKNLPLNCINTLHLSIAQGSIVYADVVEFAFEITSPILVLTYATVPEPVSFKI